MSAPVSHRPPFRKVLYDAEQRKHYPDNYVDSSFLASVRRNTGVRHRTFDELLLATVPVGQHVASIFTFAAVFALLYTDRITPEQIMWTTGLGTLVGYVLWEVADPSRRAHRSRAAVLAFVLPLLIVLLSPILRALTQSTTSDTIWTLAGVLLAFNALLADHTPRARSARLGEGFPAALSLNAAMCAATVLASRLDAHAAVSSFLLFAGVWFAFLPSVRTLVVAPFEVLLSFVALSPFGRGLATSALGILALITFGTPVALLHHSKYKDQLQGPWDQAVPQIGSHA